MLAIGNAIYDTFWSGAAAAAIIGAHASIHLDPATIEQVEAQLKRSDTQGQARGFAAGAPGNVARIAAQLGVNTTLLALLGNDPVATAYRTQMQRAQVRVLSPECSAPSGRAHIAIDAARTLGTSNLVVLPAPEWFELAPDTFTALRQGIDAFCAEPGQVYIDGYLAREAGLLERIGRALAGKPVHVALDLASAGLVEARRGELCRFVAESVDTLFADERELAALGDVSEMAPRRRGALLVKKLPPTGCELLPLGADRDAPAIRVVADAAREVDATGAGDCFAAAWIAARCAELNPHDTALFAHRAAARSVATVGATLLPTDAGTLPAELRLKLGD